MKAAKALIDLSALRSNLQRLKALAPNSQVMAVVKANAYGHGLLPTAKALEGADAFAVARIEEAFALRAGGIVKPILLLEGFFSASDIPVLEANNIQTVVHSFEQIKALETAELENPIKVWLKLDTGMHRLGIQPKELASAAERLTHCDNVFQPFNLISHFSCADELDNAVTSKQMALFSTCCSEFAGKKSLANSAGIIAWPDSHNDVIRPGIALYGVSPFVESNGAEHQLTPVMTLKSSLIAIREHAQGAPVGYNAVWHAEQDTRLGVIAIGYGDGYPRTAPQGTPVWLNGRKVPVVGRVSMDMLTVDLGPTAQDRVGDEVILWGKPLPVETVAKAVGTIGYELVTKLTQRVKLEYVGE